MIFSVLSLELAALNIKEVSKLLEKDGSEHYPKRVVQLHGGT